MKNVALVDAVPAEPLDHGLHDQVERRGLRMTYTPTNSPRPSRVRMAVLKSPDS